MDIKVIVLIIAFFVAASLGGDKSVEVNLHDCKLLFTYGYGYNNFFHITQSGNSNNSELVIRFLVRARSDAHLLLSNIPAPQEGEAVYEVVLGAGKNTFSDIRRLRRSATKSTASTFDLLSPIELRGFWVHLNGKGLIEVGKEGEETPFMFWTDPSPLNVHYFSFCTWTGVVGKWLYDCPIVNNTEVIKLVEPKPTTMTEKLRKDLLTNYNPYSLPILEKDQLIPITMLITFHHVTIDVKETKFSVDGILEMHWEDKRINWKQDDYGGLTSIHVNEHEVWIPEVVLYNSINQGTNILGHAGMTITSEGVVMWSPPVHLDVWCKMNIVEWPNDIHTCELQIGFWSQKQFLKLLEEDQQAVIKSEDQTGSEWKILRIETEVVNVNTPWDQDIDEEDISKADTLKIYVTIQRQSQPYHTIFFPPVIIINMFIMLSFWMSPMNSSKLGILSVSLVLLAFITIAIASSLPSLADHTPNLVLIYSWTMTAAVLSVLVSTLVICITRHTHSAPPYSFLCTFISFPAIRLFLILPEVNTEAGKTYNQLRENDEESRNQLDISYGFGLTTLKYQEIQQYWNILGRAIEHIYFFIYFSFIIGILTKYN